MSKSIEWRRCLFCLLCAWLISFGWFTFCRALKVFLVVIFKKAH